MQQYLEREVESFSEIKTAIEVSFSPDKDIPPGLMLGETNPGPVYPVPVAVYRPPGKIGIEKWFFRETGDIKAFITSLSDPTKEAVRSVAEKVEIDEDQVFKAALLTRTLIDNTGDRLSVVLDEGPELLTLTATSLGETNTNASSPFHLC